jgi:hypothetical protein
MHLVENSGTHQLNQIDTIARFPHVREAAYNLVILGSSDAENALLVEVIEELQSLMFAASCGELQPTRGSAFCQILETLLLSYPKDRIGSPGRAAVRQFRAWRDAPLLHEASA